MKIKALLLLSCFILSTSSNALIRIGTLFFNPPFIISPGSGFDIDLSQILCKNLQEQCQMIPMDSSKIYTSLQNGDIDLAMAEIAISPQREIDYIFSLPYLLNEGQFLVLSSTNINSTNDLANKTIGVIRGASGGSVFYNYLIENYQGQFTIKQYDDMEDMMTALSGKEIAAAFFHRSSVNYWVENGGGQFKAMGKATAIGDGMAIMALPKNQAVIDRMNRVLQLIETNGVYLKLYNTYFGNE